MERVRACVVGATGYAGVEVCRLALAHPALELTMATDRKEAGTRLDAVYPSLAGACETVLSLPEPDAIAAAADVAFLAVPHTASLALTPELLARGVNVIDLSADYRLHDPAVYEAWYATPHTSPELLSQTVYGLPELFRAGVAELVALAKAALDTLNVQKGQHIAVIGGDMLGIIVCRLLIYQQISPILIDNHTDRLEFAKQNGVYYTSYADDSLIDRIAQITGGRLADGAIFVTTSGLQDKSFPFRVSARGTNTVFCGFHAGDLMVNLDLAFRKQIAVYGVADTEDYLPTAVNLLANKAVDLSAFRIRRAPASKAASVIAEIAENPAEREVDTLDILELL